MDLVVALFRILVLLFLVRQFWHSFFGGLLCCALLVSPIAMYVALVTLEVPVELELFREMAKTNWELLFSKPFYYTDVVLNMGVTVEKMLQA